MNQKPLLSLKLCDRIRHLQIGRVFAKKRGCFEEFAGLVAAGELYRHEAVLISGTYKARSPSVDGLLRYLMPGDDLLSHTQCAISSARFRFTVLFGKGRGGSETLWPPSLTGSLDADGVERKMGRRWVLVVIV